MQKTSKIIGQNIRNIRKKKGLTLEQLAYKSNLSLTYTGDIERGLKEPSLKSLKKIANGLGVSLNYVLKPLDKGNVNPAMEMLTNEKLLSFFEFLSEGSYQELELIKNISKAISDEIKKYNRLKKS